MEFYCICTRYFGPYVYTIQEATFSPPVRTYVHYYIHSDAAQDSVPVVNVLLSY